MFGISFISLLVVSLCVAWIFGTAKMEHGFALGDGTASSASPSGSEELWWRWQAMQWRCIFMRNNVVAPLMKGFGCLWLV